MELLDATEKTPATPGIDPGTFRLVVQCLNYYATPGHATVWYSREMIFLNSVECFKHLKDAVLIPLGERQLSIYILVAILLEAEICY